MNTIAAAFFGLLAAIPAAVTLAQGVTRLFRPGEAMYGEGIVLSQSLMLGNGQPLYHALGAPPYTVAAYTPLYYWLVSLLTEVTGPSFLPGRIVALLALLAAAVLVVLAARWEVGWGWGALAGALFLAHPFVAEWAGLHRVDTLALALTLGGLLLAGRGHIVLSAVVFSAAVLTKQTYLAAPAAVFFFLLWQRRFRLAGVLAGVMIAIGLVSLVVLSWLTDGQFVQNTVAANVNPSYPEYLLSWFEEASPAVIPLLALGLAGMLLLPARWNLWKLYFCFTAFNLLALVKEGASYNYFLETFAAASILSAGVLSSLSLRGHGVFARGLVAVTLVAVVPGMVLTAADIQQVWANREKDRQAVEWAVAQINAAPGPVISEDLGVLALADKPITYEYIIYTLFQVDGRWSDEQFRAAVREGVYPRLLLLGDGDPLAGYCNCMSMSTWEELQRNYQEIDRFGKYVLRGAKPLNKAGTASAVYTASGMARRIEPECPISCCMRCMVR